VLAHSAYEPPAADAWHGADVSQVQDGSVANLEDGDEATKGTPEAHWLVGTDVLEEDVGKDSVGHHHYSSVIG